MSSLVIPDDLGNRLLQWEQESKNYSELSRPNMLGQTLYPAAVLMPLIVTEEGWNLLFTRRTDRVGTHQGEVSFPGGAADDLDDGDLERTALREVWEEIGIRPADVTVLGHLPEMNLISFFRVTPVIGMIPWPYDLKISKEEVARVFCVPLDWLDDPKNSYTQERQFEGNRYNIRYFQPYDGETIWGATAHMTWQLLQVLSSQE
ncbi:MAG: CoA pyrophosphatase [Anaerolineaceae bacterium]